LTFDPITLTEPEIKRSDRTIEANWLHPDKSFPQYKDFPSDRLTPMTVLRVAHYKEAKQYEIWLSLEYAGPRYVETRIGRGYVVRLAHEPCARYSDRRLEEIFARALGLMLDYVEADWRVAKLWTGERFTQD